jgi:nucleoside-triphosphatase THEP1
MTYWEQDGDENRSLYLSPFSPDSPAAGRNLLARSKGGRLIPEHDIISVFDTKGSEILDGSGKRDIIIMDELGRLETKALLFQESVMRCISGKAPALGVIKPERTEFLDRIRDIPDILILEVTEKNRDALLARLLEEWAGAQCAPLHRHG